jgi:hypothetical protein
MGETKMTTNTTEIKYKNPGEGAVEYANSFFEQLTVETITREKALLLINRLINGDFNDDTDKRIKCCDWCGYFYRDKTKPNNSKVCGQSCKFAKDNHAKAVKKADKELLKPKKEKSFERELYECHVHWLEYPYYVSEHFMLKRAHRYETPFSHDKLEQIDAAIQRGYKRTNKATPTDGSDKVYVRGISHKHRYGDVEVSQLEPDYFEEKYSERHLLLERKRALEFSRSKKMHI